MQLLTIVWRAGVQLSQSGLESACSCPHGSGGLAATPGVCCRSSLLVSLSCRPPPQSKPADVLAVSLARLDYLRRAAVAAGGWAGHGVCVSVVLRGPQ